MSTTTAISPLDLKSIEVLEILSEPIWKEDPEKDSLTSFWETRVLWCDIDTPKFLIGLEGLDETPYAQEATILIDDISPTYIKKGVYKKEITPNRVIFRRVA
jgi:hypothetical protein